MNSCAPAFAMISEAKGIEYAADLLARLVKEGEARLRASHKAAIHRYRYEVGLSESAARSGVFNAG